MEPWRCFTHLAYIRVNVPIRKSGVSANPVPQGRVPWDIDAYLDRIGLAGRPATDLEGFTALHRAHLLAIPFENLDIQLGWPVSLVPGLIFDKLVMSRRGGWCYEMNGLFGWALGELGFRVNRATGSVAREVRGPAFDGNHLVLRVALEEGAYLADVGFGDGPREPVALREGEIRSGGFTYALSRSTHGGGGSGN